MPPTPSSICIMCINVYSCKTVKLILYIAALPMTDYLPFSGCRSVLDFDFEKLCSVSLSHINVYACLVCGKYFQGLYCFIVFTKK